MNTIRQITICRKPGRDAAAGLLRIEDRVWPCILGKNGISVRKREGDWSTPAGSYRLIYAWHRPDHIRFPVSQLALQPISQTDGWCDAPADPNYNRPVTLPYPASAETMKRSDGLYDLVVVLDHNFSRRTRGRGSAVFFHLTADKPYTAGCIAIPQKLMLHLLPRLGPQTVMHILP